MDEPRFSERIGLVKVDRTLQINSMSRELRNSLWNIFILLNKRMPSFSTSTYWELAANEIAMFYCKVALDALPKKKSEFQHWVGKFVNECPWNEVYDFLEFMVNHHNSIVGRIKTTPGGPTIKHPVTKIDLIQTVNIILQREFSGYRFVGKGLVPITGEMEISQIEETLQSTQNSGLQGAHIHIQKALQFFGRRPEPDYFNSIKESISAVESVVKVIGGSKSSGLDGAMKIISSKVDIHPALREGFVKLYSYSSDQGGIRHCLLDEPSSVGFSEAKFMLVSCSAFVYFLLAKADEAGSLIQENKPMPSKPQITFHLK